MIFAVPVSETGSASAVSTKWRTAPYVLTVRSLVAAVTFVPVATNQLV